MAKQSVTKVAVCATRANTVLARGAEGLLQRHTHTGRTRFVKRDGGEGGGAVATPSRHCGQTVFRWWRDCKLHYAFLSLGCSHA